MQNRFAMELFVRHYETVCQIIHTKTTAMKQFDTFYQTARRFIATKKDPVWSLFKWRARRDSNSRPFGS